MTEGVVDVLLVEDEALNRALVTAILARAEDDRLRTAVVREAGTLAAARSALADRAADVVLLDVQLPDGSGLNLAAELRVANGPGPVIIALTAGALAEQREAAVAATRTVDKVHLSYGDEEPHEYLRQLAADHLIHGWDLARATGQAYEPDPAALEASYGFLRAAADDPGRGGAFGPVVPVPADAPLLDRAVGLSGRDPGWKP